MIMAKFGKKLFSPVSLVSIIEKGFELVAFFCGFVERVQDFVSHMRGKPSAFGGARDHFMRELFC